MERKMGDEIIFNFIFFFRVDTKGGRGDVLKMEMKKKKAS